ncbi:MAG: hypothetical protein Q4B26_20105 [Eubacteriales bacterium]|nr:hypothetical protein [Eubacteriales bacterium]
MYVQHPYKFEGKYYAQIDGVFYEISKEVARAMASSVMLEEDFEEYEDSEKFAEDEILKDWFEE